MQKNHMAPATGITICLVLAACQATHAVKNLEKGPRYSETWIFSQKLGDVSLGNSEQQARTKLGINAKISRGPSGGDFYSSTLSVDFNRGVAVQDSDLYRRLHVSSFPGSITYFTNDGHGDSVTRIQAYTVDNKAVNTFLLSHKPTFSYDADKGRRKTHYHIYAPDDSALNPANLENSLGCNTTRFSTRGCGNPGATTSTYMSIAVRDWMQTEINLVKTNRGVK